MLFRSVRSTVRDRGLARPGERIVVAVSGGPDSTALLHVLARLAGELDVSLVAVGVDHGLRAEASAELDLVASLARALEIPFERVGIDRAPSGASLRAWAREVRYEALHASARRLGAARIATGHTADDQAETVIARALRGAGLRGLSGIDPSRADGVVRPLIDSTREAVLRHLAEHGLAFARDPSNDATRFERTRVRRDVLPALVAEQPLAVSRLAAIADEAREAERALDAVATGLLARATDGDSLRIGPLRDAAPPIAMRALRRWAEARSARAIGRAHLVGLVERLHGPGEVLMPGGSMVRREAEALTWLSPANVPSRVVQGSDEEE